MSEFSHVRPRIRHLFEGSDEDRMLFIEANWYVPNERGKRIIAAAKKIIEPNPFHVDGITNVRPDCLIIIGEPGMGKTFIIDQIVKNFGVVVDDDSGRPILRLVYVNCPTITDLRNFFTRILGALGTPYSHDDRPDQLCEQTISSLRDAKIRALVIDELHMFLAAETKLPQHMRVLRDIANLPISIICAGTTSAETCINADDQLDQRFDRYILHHWVPSVELRNFLATFEAGLPLREPSNLAGKNLLPLIMRLSGGHTRLMARTICGAGVLAIRTKAERITEDLLKKSSRELREVGRRASASSEAADPASLESDKTGSSEEGDAHD